MSETTKAMSEKNRKPCPTCQGKKDHRWYLRGKFGMARKQQRGCPGRQPVHPGPGMSDLPWQRLRGGLIKTVAGSANCRHDAPAHTLCLTRRARSDPGGKRRLSFFPGAGALPPPTRGHPLCLRPLGHGNNGDHRRRSTADDPRFLRLCRPNSTTCAIRVAGAPVLAGTIARQLIGTGIDCTVSVATRHSTTGPGYRSS